MHNVRFTSSGRIAFDVRLGDGAPFEVCMTVEDARVLAQSLTSKVLQAISSPPTLRIVVPAKEKTHETT